MQNGKKVLPTEVSEALDINLATCTRIMGELIKRGYLEKVSRKAGYIAGPMIVSLNTRDQTYKRIAEAALCFTGTPFGFDTFKLLLFFGKAFLQVGNPIVFGLIAQGRNALGDLA
ncbi:MAG: hypothetical protein IKA87_10260 [Lentisphaeria bacterium]|nr:hypothetical protein [Lentisphaeria bacterium]